MRTLLSPLIVLFPLVACAPSSASKCIEQPEASQPDEPGATTTPATPPEGRALDLAPASGDGPVTPRVVYEDDDVKIAVVSIKAEATMEEHATPIPVTVQALSGAGTLTVEGAPFPLEPGAFLHLDANAPHALRAEGEDPLVVVVHYLKRGG